MLHPLKQIVVSEFLLLVCLHFHIPSCFIFSRPPASNLRYSLSFTCVLSKCTEQSSNRLRGGGKRRWNQMKYKCYIDYFWEGLFVRSKLLGNISLGFVFCACFFVQSSVMSCLFILLALVGASFYFQTRLHIWRQFLSQLYFVFYSYVPMREPHELIKKACAAFAYASFL